jgi:hypothetical protein
MVNEDGLNAPPPPEIDMLALAMGLQLGPGLGDGLMPGEGLGDGLIPGLGDGLGLCASVAVAPAPKKSTPMMATINWIKSGCFTGRVCGERFERFD